MKSKTAVLGTALAAILAVSTSHAEMFGGAELGYTVDTNFNGATGSAAKLKETIHSYSAYLGHYWPSADGSSALILTGDVQANRLKEASELDNHLFGVRVGSYHAFGVVHSLTTSLSARAKRFADERRDGEVYGVSLGFKQKVNESFWFREGIAGEHGTAEVSSGAYDGYGVNGSLNWRLPSDTLLSLGGAWNRRTYNVLVADVRTNTQATFGLVQAIGKHAYLRLSATRQHNSANDGNEFYTNIYSVGIGLNM